MPAAASTRSYQETLDYLFSRLPMFQRQGQAAFKKDLTNIKLLMKGMGSPHHRFPAVHLAGTNGKGSTASIISAVLQASGYKTGLYTSPHLKDFRERIRINGQPVEQQLVVDFVHRYQSLIEEVQPSFFEITVAMAFEVFAEEGVDIAVVETGLGGRLDSTNIVHPQVSVITNIGYDHQQFLGETLQEIAGEKAGIIKKGRPVVIGEMVEETEPVFKLKAETSQAPLFLASETVNLHNVLVESDQITADWFPVGRQELKGLTLGMGGAYQLSNWKTAMQTLHLLDEDGFKIKREACYQGFAGVQELTGLRGRFDWLQRHPSLIVDGAHNEQGLETLFNQLQQHADKYAPGDWHIVFGTVSDKDTEAVLAKCPKAASYYCVKPSVPRGLESKALTAHAIAAGLKAQDCSTVWKGIKAALDSASPNDLVLVTGSLFVVAEVPFERLQKI